jgi:hypothetical protein
MAVGSGDVSQREIDGQGLVSQVEAWPEDLSQLDMTAEFGRIVAAAGSPGTGW